MTHLLRLDAVAHRDEFAVRLDGHLLGHVVRDPRALTEVWSWWRRARRRLTRPSPPTFTRSVTSSAIRAAVCTPTRGALR